MTIAKGVILTRATDFTFTASEQEISWSAADHMDDSVTFWASGSPSKITVPAGISHLQFFWGGCDDADVPAPAVWRANLYEDGAAAHVCRAGSDFSHYNAIMYASPIMAVSEGDVFNIKALGSAASGQKWTSESAFFGCFTPQSRIGFAVAQLNGDTSIHGLNVTLSWATPIVDTMSTHNGTTGFVVPAGVNFAQVSLASFATAFSGTVCLHELKVNGTTVREYRFEDSSWWARGCPFGPIAVEEGDVITLVSSSTGTTLDASYTQVSIEWLGERYASPNPVDTNAINRLTLTRVATDAVHTNAVNRLTLTRTETDAVHTNAINRLTLLRAP